MGGVELKVELKIRKGKKGPSVMPYLADPALDAGDVGRSDETGICSNR